MLESIARQCVACGTASRAGLTPWHFQCHSCDYESATLPPAINQSREHDLLDEDKRESALRHLRNESFKAIVARARTYLHAHRPRLLDVGSAHGWFLEQASADFDVLGVEPDEIVCRKAAARGLPVRNGYFPDALEPSEKFDVIVFNDVIEHIPQIEDALKDTWNRLNPDGVLILNLPNSAGFFYRLSKLFRRVGVSGPFDRMWQKGLPAPHLHYFNRDNLERLVANQNFKTIDFFELPSVNANGLLERIRCVGTGNVATAYLQFLVIRCALPFLRFFKSDIMVCVFKKRAA